MQTLGDLIGKPLFTKAGERVGTVKNGLLSKNLKALRAFEYFDEQEDEHVLPVRNVLSAEDALFVRLSSPTPPKDVRPAPFGIPVYTQAGEILGNVCDFLLEGYAVQTLRLTGGKEIPVECVAGIGDALIARKAAPPRARAAERAQPKAAPAKAGSRLLTGKRAPANVCDARGNVIVKKDTLITAEVLRRAAAHNKLFELTLSVLSSR